MGRFPDAPATAPRIYCAALAEFGKKTTWPKALLRIAQLGFTHILLTEPYVARDAQRAAPSVQAEFGVVSRALDDDFVRQQIGELSKAALRHQLLLLIDLSVERADPRGALFAALLPWRIARDRALDPRAQDFGEPGAPLPWRDARAAEALLANFSALLSRCIAAGFAGCRLSGASAVSCNQLTALCAAARRTRSDAIVYLDAAGFPDSASAALVGSGVTGVINSFPWWNLHDTWFYLERERLAAIAPVIFATHTDAAPAHGMSDEGRAGALLDAIRRINIATLAGDGVLIPSHVLRLDNPSQELATSLARDSHGFDAGLLAHPVRWLRLISAPGTPIVVMTRRSSDKTTLLVAINTSSQRQSTDAAQIIGAIDRPSAGLALDPRADEKKAMQTLALTDLLTLEPFEVRTLRALDATPVVAQRAGKSAARERLLTAIAASRVVLEAVSPTCDGGEFPVLADLGSLQAITVDAYCDGHDKIAVRLQWKPSDETQWREVVMEPLINDRFTGAIPLERLGRHEFRVMAWVDRFGSWRSDTLKKRDAGRALTLETLEGLALVSLWAEDAQNQDLMALIDTLLAAPGTTAEARQFQLEVLFKPETLALMQLADRRPFAAVTPTYALNAERRGAHFASWYELFPRSMSATPGRHGTFHDVVAHLPRIAAMGFDVLYFPPIHPIGTAHRKGRNNQLVASPGDPGSPYAIGSAEGGHDSLHPQLGTLADFRMLIDKAGDEGLEIAIDFAVQCSPDHPWLKEHPAWFQFRADGTVRYAENPPKTYEDIVNVDFYTLRKTKTEPEPAAALWQALRDVVLFWVSQGIRIFRVDNPHTKPLPFWRWLIADVRARHPDTLFLAEAFTRPKMMARLAKVGFSQSYTYFTWRHSRYELATYMTELTSSPLREVYRPHFFVNTPDINPVFLQISGRQGFLIRAALATMLSGLWGMYSGFEICEGEPVPGKEEYLDSEKYELRSRDFNQAGNIVAEITRLNQIRRTNPALTTHLGVTFYPVGNEGVLFFKKSTPQMDNVILIAICLDPHHAQEFDYELPLWDWQLPDDGQLAVEDLVDGYKFTLYGKHQHMRLEPWHRPYMIWRMSRTIS